MKKVIIFAIAIVISNIALAQGKTIYVSTENVFANIPQTRVADSMIKLEAEKLSAKYEERKAEIDELVQKFLVDSITMTETQKNEKRLSLQKKYATLGDYETELKGDLENYKEKQYAPVRKKVLDTINAIAKARAAQTVLYKESALIIPPNTDITEEVIKKVRLLK